MILKKKYNLKMNFENNKKDCIGNFWQNIFFQRFNIKNVKLYIFGFSKMIFSRKKISVPLAEFSMSTEKSNTRNRTLKFEGGSGGKAWRGNSYPSRVFPFSIGK